MKKYQLFELSNCIVNEYTNLGSPELNQQAALADVTSKKLLLNCMAFNQVGIVYIHTIVLTKLSVVFLMGLSSFNTFPQLQRLKDSHKEVNDILLSLVNAYSNILHSSVIKADVIKAVENPIEFFNYSINHGLFSSLSPEDKSIVHAAAIVLAIESLLLTVE